MDLNDNPTEGAQILTENTKELEIEDLITELCLNTSSDPVKFWLRKYKYGKVYKTLRMIFLKNDMTP